MRGSDWAWLIVVAVPLAVVIGSTVLHVLRRSDIGSTRKVLWLGLIVLAPALGALVYLVARPLPLVDMPQPETGGPDRELADLVVRYEAGDLDRPAFQREARKILVPVLAPTTYQVIEE